jgi:uncharacterized membrane protein
MRGRVTATSRQEERLRTGGLQFERLVFFSDAVMAIAITLLALDIRLPEAHLDAAPGDLTARVLALGPQVQSYVISFLVIGLYWVTHHRTFGYIQRYDARLIWLNLLFLMLIAFLPFPTSLLGDFPDEQAAVILFAATVAAIGAVSSLTWWYATHGHRLVEARLDRHTIRWGTVRGLIPLVVFLFSIGIAVVDPSLAKVFWGLTWLAYMASSLFRP